MKLANFNGQPEIFYSIQGEGISMGKPAIFVRLSQCNLHCIWCDTDYTWNWKSTPFPHKFESDPNYSKYDKSEWIIELSAKEVYDRIKEHACKRVILTGGEPLMQQKELSQLAHILKNDGYFLEMETNGTYIPTDKLNDLLDQFNVSPKLSNSNNELKLRLKEKVMDHFSSSDKATFKFVIANEPDLKEVEELIEAHQIPSSKIYLMPEGTTPQELNAKQQWLVEVCKSKGYNYTDRLHVHIYGSKRGV